MKVFDSLNSTHTFKVVPRYYSDVTSLVLKNEANNELKNFDPVIFSTLNGFIDITFDTSFTDKEKGEILVNGDDGVIYRGSYFVTSEDTQSNQINGYLYYEH